jgi:uracil-DNA glycosylase
MSDIELVQELTWDNFTLSHTLHENIPKGWEEFFNENKEVIHEISDELEKETRVICPVITNVFNAFYMCPFDSIKCIILAQDPYWDQKTAYGLAFSSYPGSISVPASLRNIFKKLRSEGYNTSSSYLGGWAHQGVFLINTALTVPEGCPEKHLKLWSKFTQNLFGYLQKKDKIVWILWGKKAQIYKKYCTKGLVLEGGHPSPVNTRGDFLDKDYFGPCNTYLESVGKLKIDWNP